MKISSITENLCLRVINTEACRRFMIVAVASIFSLAPLMAQDGTVRPSRIEAQAAWDKGNYPLAYEHYNGLLLLYSRDPLYKHYAGACLVKMQQDIPRAVTLLGSAINSSVNIKSVPDDVWFYYGRALQMNGSFVQAREAFDRFARIAGRRVAAEYDVQSYIDQCSRGMGALSLPAGEGNNNTAGAVTTARTGSVTTDKTGATTTVAPSGTPASGTTYSGTITTGTTGSDTTTTGTAVSGTTGTGTNTLRTNASGTTNSGTNVAGTTASPNNASGTTVTGTTAGITTAKNISALDRAATTPKPDTPAEYDKVLTEAMKLQHEADSISRAGDDTARTAILQAKADSLFLTLEELAEPPSEKTYREEPEILPQSHIVSDFEVRQSPAYSERNPVPVDFAMPPGLVYTVQIAAFRNPVAPTLFRGLYPVFGSRRAGSDVIFYYTALFRRLEDARQALPGARSSGFPDAFIIAFMDGTRVSMERAGLLEKEWASKPLPGKETLTNAVNETSADPVAPVKTLSFRAEVMRISKPAKPEMIEKMQLLAGSRGLDMIKNSNGETVFLIGNFITFESADEYVSLLIRNGYSTARVAAYVGMQEIPVESAKELLNRLHDD